MKEARNVPAMFGSIICSGVLCRVGEYFARAELPPFGYAMIMMTCAIGTAIAIAMPVE